MKKMNQQVGLMLCLAVTAACVGCGSEGGSITVVSREDGSGTRGAFVELCGIEQDDVDRTVSTAEITNSTAVMLTTVANNKDAIGYVSMGSLDDSVKAVQVEGVEAAPENVSNGSYAISRPFNIVTNGEAASMENEAAIDFINYIMSADGQAVIEEKDYIPVSDAGAYQSNGASGTVSVAGSSSVTPVMQKLAEEYMKVNQNVKVEVNQSDSSTGVTSALEGACDIGMASRELKDSETAEGAVSTVIAMDGIAVVVNTENPVTSLTLDQICKIYTGEVTEWSAVTGE